MDSFVFVLASNSDAKSLNLDVQSITSKSSSLRIRKSIPPNFDGSKRKDRSDIDSGSYGSWDRYS